MPSVATDLRTFIEGNITFPELAGLHLPGVLGESVPAVTDLDSADQIKLIYSIADGYIENRMFTDGELFIQGLFAFWELADEVKSESYLLASEFSAYQSRFEDAVAHLDNAGRIIEKTSDVEKLLRVRADISAFLKRTGDYGRARDEAEAGLKISRGGDYPKWEMRLWNNLGLVLKEIGDHSGSIDALRKSVDLAKGLNAEKVLAANLVNIGTLYRRIGRDDQAVEFMKRALGEWEKLENKREVARCLNNLGNYVLDADPVKAEEYLVQGAGIAVEEGYRDVQTMLHFNLGLLRRRSDHPDDALREFQAAEESALATGDTEYIWRTGREIGNLLLESGKLSEARERIVGAVDVLSSTRQGLSSDEDRVGFLSSREILFADLVEADLALNDDIQVILDIQKVKGLGIYELFAGEDAAGFDIESLEKIQTSFSAGRILALDYFLTGKKLVIGVVSPNGAEVVRVDFDEDDFESTVRKLGDRIKTYEVSPELRGNPGRKDKELQTQLEKLYEIFMKPVEKYLTEAGYLAVIPHGLIGDLPFAAFGGPDGYLVEKLPLSVFPNLSIGGELLSEDGVNIENMELSLVRGDTIGLEDAASEASSVVEGFPGRSTEVRDTELDSFCSTGSDWIHFVGHGEFDASSDGAPILKGPDGRSIQFIKRGEDAPSVAILSACQTGLGKMKGASESINLARSMFASGGKSLVSSLWQVSDVHTSRLIREFYTALKGSENIAGAMASAQKRAIDRGWHPYFWAGFTVAGDIHLM